MDGVKNLNGSGESCEPIGGVTNNCGGEVSRSMVSVMSVVKVALS